jgi:hypothetical protein
MKLSVVILCIVGDDDDPATATLGSSTELAQKLPAGLSVETTFWLGGDQSSVCDSYRTEVADAFPSRCMSADRITNLRRDPHTAATTVLLEMDFIHRPEIDISLSGEPLEFFLLRPAPAGPLELLPVWACADGIQGDETVVGIAGRVVRRRIVFPESWTTAGHPKAAPAVQNRQDSSLVHWVESSVTYYRELCRDRGRGCWLDFLQ